MVLITASCTMLLNFVHTSSDILSTRSNPLNFFVTSTQDLSHSQLLVLFLLTVWSFSIFGYKEYNQSDFDIDHLVMSMCSVFSCVVERGCLLWPVCSLGKTLLTFALHFVLQGQTCLLDQVSPDFLLLHSIPLWWKGYLFWVLVLCLVGLHGTIQIQLLWH